VESTAAVCEIRICGTLAREKSGLTERIPCEIRKFFYYGSYEPEIENKETRGYIVNYNYNVVTFF
jgi:hypothetical protein